MVLCLINGVTLHNLPYGSHKNVYGATIMYGKLDKSFDMCGHVHIIIVPAFITVCVTSLLCV